MAYQTSKLATVAMIAVITGCSSTPPPQVTDEAAGEARQEAFVSQVESAIVGPAYQGQALEAIAVRRQVFVAPVRVEATDDDAFDGLQPDEIDAYATAFHTAIIEALPPDVAIVESPAEARLIVEPALTDIDTSLGAVAAVTTFVPHGLLVSLGARAITGEHLGVGGASMRLDLLDAPSRMPILTVTDAASASKTSFGRIADPGDDPREVFGVWAAWLASAFT